MSRSAIVPLVLLVAAGCTQNVGLDAGPDSSADGPSADGNPLPDASRDLLPDAAAADTGVTYPHTVHVQPLGFRALRVAAANQSLRILGRFSGTMIAGASTVTALGYSDVCVVGMTATGAPTWAVQVGGDSPPGSESEWGNDLAMHAKGTSCIAGGFVGTTHVGPLLSLTSQGEAELAACLGPKGLVQWASAGGCSTGGSADGLVIAIDPDGNTYVAGTFQGVASFGNAVLASNGGKDLFLLKQDPAGQVVWAISAGGKKHDQAVGLAVDPAGNALVAGNYHDGIVLGSHTLETAFGDAMFLAKLTASGEVLWAVSSQEIEGLDGVSVATGLGVNGNGDAYLGGHFGGTITIGAHSITSHKSTVGANSLDVFVAKVSAKGVVRWIATGGGPGDDYLRDLDVDAAGYALLTGKHRTDARFGTFYLTASGPGYSDLYLARLDPKGHYVNA